MTASYDGQAEVIEAIEDILEMPNLDAEELGRVVIALERLVHSRLVTPNEAGKLLADRKWGR